MFGFLKKKKKDILPLDEVYFDLENKDLFFEKYFDTRTPVLIKGGAASWQLIKLWNKEYITKKSGSYHCTVVSDSRPAAETKKTTLKKYFKEYTNKSTLTLEQYIVGKEPSFFKDIPFPNAFFTKQEIARFFFFHSVKNAGTLPHKHGDAFNILQAGEKKWIFFDAHPTKAPKGFKLMNKFHREYPRGAQASDWFANEVPLLPGQVPKAYICTQEKGDIVYIPADYAHTVLNNSEVMGLVIERKRNI